MKDYCEVDNMQQLHKSDKNLQQLYIKKIKYIKKQGPYKNKISEIIKSKGDECITPYLHS